MPDFSTLLAAGALAFVAGVVRGYTGFGTPLLMAPFYVVVFGPAAMVPLLAIMEVGVIAVTLRSAWNAADRAETGRVFLGCLVFVPVGLWLIAIVDPLAIKRLIGAVVTAFAVIGLTGWRYRGPRGPLLDGVVGAISGTLGGLSGVAGPPVIVYWLGGGDPMARVRANLSLYFTALTVLLLVLTGIAGMLTAAVLRDAAILTPCVLAGSALGAWLFDPGHERGARRAALCVVLLAGLYGLLG